MSTKTAVHSAYDVAVSGWVADSTGFFHVSVSNLPLRERTDGVTLCFLRDRLSRMETPPWPFQRPKVCHVCVDELLEMGERVPAWMM